MSNTIQIRRGLEDDISASSKNDGELKLTTDSKKVFITYEDTDIHIADELINGVSTATQDALDDKFDKTGGTVTGVTTFEQDVNGRDITADGDKLDLITVTAAADLDDIRDNSARKLQDINTGTVYDDSNTDTNYKMYIEDGKIILEEL